MDHSSTPDIELTREAIERITAQEERDGGPAFPSEAVVIGECRVSYRGVSIRDYFAGQALAGCLAYPGNETDGSLHTNASPELVAQICYGYADAMLSQRKEDTNANT